jgi:hypothetical protein
MALALAAIARRRGARILVRRLFARLTRPDTAPAS